MKTQQGRNISSGLVHLTNSVFELQLVRRGIPPEALKRGVDRMADIDSDGFLREYRIEFPSVSSLAVLHAEPVSQTPSEGYTFSNKALQIISDLINPSDQTADYFNQSICDWSSEILFFLDAPYFMHQHIWAVRNSIDEIAMVSCVVPGEPNLEDPPPAGLLQVVDVATLAELAQRSPFLGQLLPIADGPPDAGIWAYFLGKAEQEEIEDGEGVEVSIKIKKRAPQSTSPLRTNFR